MNTQHNTNIIGASLNETPYQKPRINFIITDPATAPVEPLDFIIDGMAARKLISVFAGPPGSGKSFLAQYLLQTRSTTLVNVKPGIAFYLTGADASESEVRNRAHKIFHNGQSGLRTIYADEPELLCLVSSEDFVNGLIHELIKLKVDAIVFDTIRDYYDGDSKEAQIANQTMVAFRRIAEQANVAAMLITHTRKSASERNELKIDDVADSRIFTAKADFVFGLQHEYREEDRTSLVQIINLKTRSSRPIPRIRYLVKDIDGAVHFEPTNQLFKNENKAMERKDETMQRNAEILRMAEEGMSQEKIALQLGISRPTVAKVLKIS